jgi:serine protease Do
MKMRKRTVTLGRSSFGFRMLIATLLLLPPMAGPAGCTEQEQPAGEKQVTIKQVREAFPAESTPPGPRTGGIDLVTAIEQVAQNTIPAVVHIEATERQEVPHPRLPFMDDPFFRRFFDRPDGPESFEREVRGIGTGMVMDAQGHILTNYHVAGGASRIMVLLADGRTYPAELIGGDPKTDLAILKIKADGELPQVTFGDSNQVQVGEWVVAIGHPQGLNQTVTKGIISAKHRSGITDPTTYQDFLQTDAAINPGNSGGPLLNLRGEVIGINAAIASTTGGFQGIGFAIPSNMALYVARQIIEQGEVRRGWLGVSVQNVTAELAKSIGLERIRGGLVADVMQDSPAARAGLRKGDVVIAFQGEEIADGAALRNAVATTPIGEQATITVIRNGDRQEVTVAIGSLEKAQEMMTSSVEERLGAEFRAIPPERSLQAGIQPGQGLEITAIGEGPLARAGLENGDFILAVNDQPIDSPETLAALIRQQPPGQSVALLAVDHRTGRIGYIQVNVR